MTTLERSFSARQVPWMKIGTIIDDPDVDSAEAARLGGIDFDVELQPAGRWQDFQPVRGDEDVHVTDEHDRPLYVHADPEHDGYTTHPGRWLAEPSRFATVRQDTNEWFAYVSNDYRVVQYREAFAFMDEINPRYVAAGAMSDGRQGFMVVKLPERERLNVTIDGVEDPHELYVVLRTSHDLSRGMNVAVLPLRERCMNMMTLPSFDRNVPQSWAIRHVGDPLGKLKDAQLSLQNTHAYADLFERMVQQYASVRITVDDLRQIARRAFPARLKTIEAQVEAVVDRFRNADTVGFQDTGWGAINAVSDYLQWGRANAVRTDQSEFTSGMDGDTAKVVNRTAQLVMTRA